MSVRDLAGRMRHVAADGLEVMATAGAAELRDHFEAEVHHRTGRSASETEIIGLPDGTIRISGPRSLRFPPTRDALRMPDGALGAAAGRALGAMLGGAR